MTINGLENNYYLTQNDIWVTINGFTNVVAKIVVDFKNITTNEELNDFDCSSSPNNDCSFNICQPIRALMPEPNHIINNNLQQFQIKITTKFQNTTIPDEVLTITKYFIRGGRDRSGAKQRFLNEGDFLIENYWIDGGASWMPLNGIMRINSGNIIEDNSYPLKTKTEERKNCNGILVKYLNSFGAYQYFYFDRYEDKFKTKAQKSVQRIAKRLSVDNFQNIGYDETETRSLYAYTEKKLQPNFKDLVRSPNLFYYDENGNDDASRWHLIKLDDNTSTWNNYENAFENKVEFTLPNYRNNRL